METLCPSCNQPSQFFGERMLIELQYSHKCCLTCCAETGPQDNFKVNCTTCNTSQQIKNQCDVSIIENFK